MTNGFLRWMRRGLLFRSALLLGLLGLALGGASSVEAQGPRLTVHPESQFWIQGTATTHSFTCQVEHVEGTAALPAAQEAVPASADDEEVTVQVRVPVRAFDCGNDRMTRDLQETLKGEEHPHIRFELVHATVGEPLDPAATWRRIHLLGTLTIAGTKRLRRFQVRGRALDENHFRVRGCHTLRMTYFGIEPPTKAFGLIKVKDRVTVLFDLLASREGAPTAPLDSITITDPPSCEAE